MAAAFGLEGEPNQDRPTACIPLKVGDEAQGFIVILARLQVDF